ncbi:CSC1-like protein HYP1 [Dendronephthya gigantea]|uniref:CSC1-like protein HYP1 n=1 Tax=Dendronephthya gigantea TaxID=151771 RepID=UPI00106D78C6|nr:CSC1-like protein HYP1 [Dendronephthya gigantea]
MASIEAFITSLIFNVGITLIILVVFCILRPRFDFVYQPNFKMLTECLSKEISETKRALLRKLALSSEFFRWLTPAFKVSRDELYDLVGFDAFVYLRFLRLCFRIAAFLLPYAVLVLIPVSVNGGNDQKGMDILTLGNITQESDKLWAHLIGVWLFSFLMYYLLYTEWHVYVEYRQRYLKENKENHFSVLVTQLPSEIVSIQHIPLDEDLKKLIEKIFPDQVAFCYVVENTEDWQELLKKHDDLILKLERAKAILEEKGERPQHRVKLIIGNKTDSIQYYEEELKSLQDKLMQQDSDVTRRAVPAAIITFKTLRDASIATQVLWQAKPYHTMVQPAPESRDVIWKNLEYPLWNRWLRWTIISVLLFFLVVFWMIPVTFIQSLVTLESLQKKVSFLRFVNDLSPVVVGLIEGVLSTLAFVVFFAILPMIMEFISRQQGLLSLSDVDSSVIEKLYIFAIVNKFLGSVLAGAFFDKVQQILDHPTSLPKLLAMSLPAVGSFFINYVILQALTGHAIKLLRIVPLIMCNVKKRWLAKTEREQKLLWSPPTPSYGEMYSEDLFVFIIGVCYCVQAPIVLPFVLLYFGFGYIVNFYFMVYVTQTKYNAGGKMWFPVFNRMVFAVVVFQILMIGIFALKNNPTVSTLSIPPLVLTIIFYIFINMYWKRIATFMELITFSSLDDDTTVDEETLKTAHEKYIRNKIFPPLYSMSTDHISCDEAVDDDNENKPTNEQFDSLQVTTSVSDTIGLV